MKRMQKTILFHPSMIRWMDILLMAVLGAFICLLLDKWIVAAWAGFHTLLSYTPLGFSGERTAITVGLTSGVIFCALTGIGGVPYRQTPWAFFKYPPAGLAGVLGGAIYLQAWTGPNLLLFLIGVPILAMIYGFRKYAMLFIVFWTPLYLICVKWAGLPLDTKTFCFFDYSLKADPLFIVHTFSGFGIACLCVWIVRHITLYSKENCIEKADSRIDEKADNLSRDQDDDVGEQKDPLSRILRDKETFRAWLEVFWFSVNWTNPIFI